jgi:hypothetical protein
LDGTDRQSQLDPERPVFNDETWIKINMASLRGFAPRASGAP